MRVQRPSPSPSPSPSRILVVEDEQSIRDVVATELDMDPGVVCSRDRMEAVARRNPTDLNELTEVTELRRWQAEVLGPRFVDALSPNSPYADG